MSHDNKRQRREQVKQWKNELRTELAAAMPMSPDQLRRLLDYLDAYLKACDHSTKVTEIFLHVEKLDKNVVLQWLADHGAFCDCEVLANLDDLDRELQRPPPTNYYVPVAKTKSEVRDLRSKTGWDLAKLPSPWRVGNLYKPEEPIQLQIGKKGGCTLQILEKAMPAGEQAGDEYWANLWYARTNLPKRGPLRICHASLELPEPLRATVVQAPDWLPVFGWIIPAAGDWHVEFRTESNRADGDFKQIAALMTAVQAQS